MVEEKTENMNEQMQMPKTSQVWEHIDFLHCTNVLELTEANERFASDFNCCLSADVLMCPFLESISCHYKPHASDSDSSRVDKTISEQQKH